MRILTRRNGKILTLLGFAFGIIGVVGITSMGAILGQKPGWTYNPATLTFSFFFIIGSLLTIIGIPILITGIIMWPRTVKRISNVLRIAKHAKVDTLAKQLSIGEKEVIQALTQLQSKGEPITFDQSINEAAYDHTLAFPSPQSTAEIGSMSIKAKSFEWSSYEKISLLLGITSLIISITLTLLKW